MAPPGINPDNSHVRMFRMFRMFRMNAGNGCGTSVLRHHEFDGLPFDLNSWPDIRYTPSKDKPLRVPMEQ